MKKLLLLLFIVFAAMTASLATARVASASNFEPTCTFSDGYYKYSGFFHHDTSLPTWSQVKLNQTVQWWGFTDQNWHAATWNGIANFSYPGGGKAWIQAGFIAGYDPWGNQIDSNYPWGVYDDNYHPNPIWPATGPSYTPNGTAVDARYAEKNVGGFETMALIGSISTGNGLTLIVQNNGSGYFSMVDQDGNPIGGSTFQDVYLGSTGNYYAEAFQESESKVEGSSYCAWDSASTDNFDSTDNNLTFWGSYYGCSGNGWNGDNSADGTCRGGAGTQTAPLDVYAYGPGGTSMSSFSTYCQEGINGLNGPMIRADVPMIRNGVKAARVPILVSSDNPRNLDLPKKLALLKGERHNDRTPPVPSSGSTSGTTTSGVVSVAPGLGPTR